MANSDERSWQEVAAGNRERVRALEHEQDRMRDAIHKLNADTAAITYLAKEVGKLDVAVESLSEHLERIAKRAVERPTATGLGVVGQYLAVLIALAALVVAVTR